MKRFSLLTVVICFLIACQDTKESAHQNLPQLYDRSVGEQIPLDVAKRWAESFSANVAGGRTSGPYSLDVERLELLMTGDQQLGMILHHGLDDMNEYHLMMYSIDTDNELFKNPVLDLSSGTLLDRSIAKLWSDNYAEEHPATPWYHFFGRDVFQEILSDGAFDSMDIVRGLNDDSQEQILLFVNNSSDSPSGRTKGEGVTVYDFSQPCPPCSSN